MQYQVDVNADGNWELDIYENFELGSYAITATDNYGNADLAIFHVKGKQTFEPTKLQGSEVQQMNIVQIPGTWIGPGVLLGIFFFLILILIFVTNYSLAKKIRKQGKETHEKTIKLAKRIMILSSVFIVLFIVLVALIIFKYENFRNDIQIEVAVEGEEKVQISGMVQTPFAAQGVPGLELTVGNVSIMTGNGGAFNFSEVGVDSGIKITDQELQQAIKYVSGSPSPINILYEATLFNRLGALIDLQARGELANIKSLTHGTMSEISEAKVYSGMPGIYFTQDIQLNSLTVVNTELLSEYASVVQDRVYTNVIRITVKNRGKIGIYNFIFAENDWKYIQ